MPAAEGIGRWHKLTLSFVGNRITATIDGADVAPAVTDNTYTAGLAGYQVSRWQNAQFMNFEVVPAE